MCRPAFVVLYLPLVAFGLSAQSLTPEQNSLLLKSETDVSGVVMDSSDQAIEGAYVENTGSPRAITSDASGHFRLSTRAPSFVVRKEGYNSVFVRTTSTNPVVVTLTESRYSAPRCPNKSACDSVAGFGARFCFPRIEGVKVSKRVNDVDYGQRTFSVRTKHGRGTISYGSGPQWSLGWPPDEDVWRSVEYSERIYAAKGAEVLDARGKTADGKLWRYLGTFGESASYEGVDAESAALLDKVLDGFCFLDNK
jgi:hypothetical protein